MMEIYSNHIAIKNIYYMLTYAFRALRDDSMKELSKEHFEDMLDLMSAILIKGVAFQLKHGLLHDYEAISEERSTVRGKILLGETIKSGALTRKKLYCGYDEYSENTIFNSILKTTMLYLIRADIPDERKMQLKRQYAYFGNVDIIDQPIRIRWEALRYNRNNAGYELIMTVCNIILTSMLVSTEAGDVFLRHYSDEQKIYHLYEKFILEYYKKHFKQLSPCSPEIKWALEGASDDFLPKMQSDIVLRDKDKTLIIDAKFYSFITQSQYEKKTYHNGNLYQIFTYVKNEEANTGKTVSGILLYAKTDEDVPLDSPYKICGNEIGVKALDLSSDFDSIKARLNSIANEHFRLQVTKGFTSTRQAKLL